MFEELIKQTKENYFNDYTEIDIAGNKVKVYEYVPIELKRRLVRTVLDAALTDNGIYDEVALDMGFALGIIDLYTNIEITEDEANGLNAFDVYNYFDKNGYLKQIVDCINEDEYKQLFDYVVEQRAANEKGHIGIINYINNLVNSLPKELNELLEAFEKINNEDDEKVVPIYKTTEKLNKEG